MGPPSRHQMGGLAFWLVFSSQIQPIQVEPVFLSTVHAAEGLVRDRNLLQIRKSHPVCHSKRLPAIPTAAHQRFGGKWLTLSFRFRFLSCVSLFVCVFFSFPALYCRLERAGT